MKRRADLEMTDETMWRIAGGLAVGLLIGGLIVWLVFPILEFLAAAVLQS